MASRHDIRRLAMQLLYQIDLRGEADLEAIRRGLNDGVDPPEMAQTAFELAAAAWQKHAEADALATELAPAWPTPRQPPVDRAILRLAYFEMLTGRAPVKVAINEAVELAKEYCSEQSPPFINGVLDKVAKRVTPEIPTPAPEPGLAPKADPWLHDALDHPGGEKP